MRNRALIFTGGRIGDWALREVGEGDRLIAADSGALFLIRHGLNPDAALGDFDSVTEADRERIRAAAGRMIAVDAVDKDWTDTEMAFNYAVSLGVKEIVIFGGLGTRFDHSLANVHLLARAADLGLVCRVEDDHNRVQLVCGGQRLEVRRDRFPYVSLLPLTAEVTGIDLHGFQYPLADAVLRLGESLGISNRLVAPTGSVSCRSGRLLVIGSRD
jgi:thiamine pyrophosphokinase